MSISIYNKTEITNFFLIEINILAKYIDSTPAIHTVTGQAGPEARRPRSAKSGTIKPAKLPLSKTHYVCMSYTCVHTKTRTQAHTYWYQLVTIHE